MKQIICALIIVGFVFSVSASTISLIPDNNNPDPNEEVTVYVHTDTPLFALGLGVYVLGDANITTAMSEDDCNQYGWDNGWNSDPYIDPNGYIYLNGVRWASDANGIIGYFKFRFNRWQTRVYIDQENSCSIGWDGVNPSYNVPFSTEVLSFGEPDPNEPNEVNYIPSEEDILRQQAIIQQRLEEMQSRLHTCPSGGGREQLSLRSDELSELDSMGSRTISGYERWNSDIEIDGIIIVDGLLEIVPEEEQLFITRLSGGIHVRNGTIRLLGVPSKEVVFISTDGSQGPLIYIDVNSSTESVIQNCIFYDGWYEYAPQTAVYIDNKNIKAINNCQFLWFDTGLWMYGPELTTEIGNNVFYGNSYAMDLHMGGEQQPNDRTHCIIKYNTFNYNGSGLMITASEDPCNQQSSEIGYVEVIGNHFTECSLGLSFWAGGIYRDVKDNCYWSNEDNWNLVDFSDQVHPVFESSNPYVESPSENWYWYLRNDACSVNIGSESILQNPEFACSTVFSNHNPRSGIMSLGAGKPLWSYSNAGTIILKSDFNNDNQIDLKDLYTLAFYWLSNEEEPDLNNDDIVNFSDYATFASEIGKTSNDPNIYLVINGDANSGIIDVSINGANQGSSLYLFVNGRYKGNIPQDEGNFQLETFEQPSGKIEIKAAVVDMNTANTILVDNVSVGCNGWLSSLVRDTHFDSDEPYRIQSKPVDATIDFKNPLTDQVIDSYSFNGDITINNFSQLSKLAEFTINENTSLMMEGSLSETFDATSEESHSWDWIVSHRLHENLLTYNAKVVISIPNWYGSDNSRDRKPALVQLCNKLEERNVEYFLLWRSEATSKNIKDALIGNPYTRMWFHTGTGFHKNPSFVPYLDLADGMMFALLAKSFTSQGYPVPSNYIYQPSYIENGANEFGVLLSNSAKIKVSFIDNCQSNKTDYWPWVLGGYSGNNESNHDQVMIGWKVVVFGGYKYASFVEQFFLYFIGHAGDKPSVQASLEYAKTHTIPYSHGNAIWENNFVSGLDPKWWYGYGLPTTSINFHDEVEAQ
jgi:hypothetical protein